MGRANKFLIRLSKKIICYDKNIKLFPNKYIKKIYLINPILRKEIYYLEKNKKKDFNELIKILIIGGSQGAKFFDETLTKVILKVSKKFEIEIHQQIQDKKNKDLIAPINVLEKEKDKKRTWRNFVNIELKTRYKKIFKLIDLMIFLKIPSFEYVYKWRLLQEKKLRVTSKGKKTMSNKQVKNFIMFYERITRNMLKNFSKKANITINLDKSHRLKSLKLN